MTAADIARLDVPAAQVAAERIAALFNELELDGREIYTVGSSVVIDDVTVVSPNLGGEVWAVVDPTPPDPRYRVQVNAPERYFRSNTGVLHLRDLITGGGLSEERSRCGRYFERGRSAVPQVVSERSKVCKKCHRTEPSL